MAEDHVEARSPEDAACYLSRFTFVWVMPFFRKAYYAVKREEFSEKLFPPVPPDQNPEANIVRLRTMWEHAKTTKGKKAQLFPVILHFMRGLLGACTLAMMIQALLLMATPMMVRKLVECIGGEDSAEVGYAIAGALTALTAVCAVIQQYSWHMSSRCAMQVWLALTGLIFEKPARLSSSARSDITEGQLVSLMSQDAQQMLNFMSFYSLLVSAPVYLIASSIALTFLLGWPFFIGLAVVIFSTFICERLAEKMKTLYVKKMQMADGRNKCLNESFQGIRTVKLNAWEVVMEDRVEVAREKEMSVVRQIHILSAVHQSLSFGLPQLGIVASLMVYVLNGGEFDAALIFASIAFFQFLVMGATFLPFGFTLWRMMKASMDRIQQLLIKDDDFSRGATDGDKPGTVNCVGLDLRWTLEVPAEGPALPALAGVNMDVNPGDLVAICGRVGSGKTTLAGGMLGLVSRTAGSLSVSGSIAYVTQTPQIMNDTIKENILFGSALDEEWYDRVLEACQLKEDLKVWDNGDETEIGERGITISGGQKQRVAIARAAYSRADIIVFDDPLSAMDAHVGKLVFDACFRGLLANSTRIFCTNQLQWCNHCTHVYMLEEGRVSEHGSYQELATKSPPGPFAIFLQSVVGSSEEGDASQAITDSTREPSDDANQPKTDANIKTAELHAVTEEVSEKKMPDEPKGGDSKAALAKLNAEKAGEGNKKDTGKVIVAERKHQGGIGVRDWMQIARASNSACLGAGVLLVALLNPTLNYGTNFMLSRWTDNLLDDEGAPTGADAFDDKTPSILYVSTAVGFMMSLMTFGVLCTMYFMRSSRTLHNKMLATTLRQPMGWFDSTPVGRILNRFGQDVMSLDFMLPRLFPMWSLQAGLVVLTIIMSGIIVPPALLLSIMVVILICLLKRYYVPVALDLQRVFMMSVSPLLAAQSCFLGAMDTIRCFDRVDIFVGRFYKQQADFIKAFYWQFALDRAVQCFFATFASSAFMGCVGAMLVSFGNYDTPFSSLATPGKAGVVLAYLSMLSQQAPMVLFMTTNIEKAMAGVQRIVEFKDSPTEDSLQKVKEPVAPEWPANGVLSLQQVQMRYRDGLPLALDGVDLTVKPGEKIGIVGRTGSGKSSIILTCFRMVDCAGGKILVDENDISRVAVADLRARLGVIPQDSWLFSGTIRSNLDVRGDKTDEEIWSAIQHVQLESQIKAFEAGLDHEVKEKGENLSAGTAQLLCLARVLLKQPKLLFMDEATASVDSETDLLVQATIRKDGVLPADCSIVTVAHRLHTVIDYDRIIVMDKGRVVEDGAPHVLLEKDDGYFASLVRDTGEAGARELKRRAHAAFDASEDGTTASKASI